MYPPTRPGLRRRHPVTPQYYTKHSPQFFTKPAEKDETSTLYLSNRFAEKCSLSSEKKNQVMNSSSSTEPPIAFKPLIFWQKKALEALQKYGFTEHMLLDLHIADEDFTDSLEAGLCILVEKLPLEKALTTMKKMYTSKGYALGDNIERANIFSGDSYWYIISFIEFESYGLTIEKLLTVPTLGYFKYCVLDSLIKFKKESVDNALGTIKDINPRDLVKLSFGLDKEYSLWLQKQEGIDCADSDYQEAGNFRVSSPRG